MAMKKKNVSKVKIKKGSVVVQGVCKGLAGGQVWVVKTPDGRERKIATKSSSAASMDRAVKRFKPALKRLGER